MGLKIKQFVLFVTFLNLCACKQQATPLTSIEASNIAVDSANTPVDSILQFTKPYRDRINTVLDSTLAFSPTVISKTDGEFNTSAGNLMADIILEQAEPIFSKRTGHNIDFVLVNHGGIRSIISKGKVTARNAYEVMPFENTIVVVELTGASVATLVEYLVKSKRAHPISGMQIVLHKNGILSSVKIQGKPLQEHKNYFVATSNYLVSGGDDMVFFKDGLSTTDTDYLIRNAMIDYFQKVDTLRAKVDDRYFMIE